jgi:hypothetical protein
MEAIILRKGMVDLPKIFHWWHLNDSDRFSWCPLPVIEVHQQVFESDQTHRALVDDRKRLPVHVEYNVSYGL